jgi:hypothetical protein
LTKYENYNSINEERNNYMEPLEIKKQILKNIITPFFKNNGFIKSGVKYSKNINHLIIVANIQSQRYYKDEKVENFRINIMVYPEISQFFYFRYYAIDFPETSWITIDEETNIEELKIKLNKKLSEVLIVMNEYNDVEKVVEKMKEEINELNNQIVKKKKDLEIEFEKESRNENLINIEKNTIEICNRKVDIINNWIKTANE